MYKESKAQKKYTLIKGHAYSFYNKGKYLHKRYLDLISEMKSRGFSPAETSMFPDKIFINNNLYNDWVPDNDDLLLLRKRIN